MLLLLPLTSLKINHLHTPFTRKPAEHPMSPLPVIATHWLTCLSTASLWNLNSILSFIFPEISSLTFTTVPHFPYPFFLFIYSLHFLVLLPCQKETSCNLGIYAEVFRTSILQNYIPGTRHIDCSFVLDNQVNLSTNIHEDRDLKMLVWDSTVDKPVPVCPLMTCWSCYRLSSI